MRAGTVDQDEHEDSATKRWRLFVAIDLGEEARAALIGAQTSLRRHKLPVRWVDPLGAHLTVKFLGPVAPEQVDALASAIQVVAAAHRPFVLRTGAPGAFPNERRPRVLWLGLQGPLDHLAALRQATEDALCPLGFPPEARAFHPHLTLGRARPEAIARDWAGLTTALAALHGLEPVPLPVAALRLMRSELSQAGARYTALTTAPLQGV